MKFCWCTIKVNNMEDSMYFYQEIVGLPVNNKIDSEQTKICFLGDGETKIELLDDGSGETSDNIKGISIGFEVDSVDEKIKMIKEKGLKVLSGPTQPNPYIKFFFVKDPNGVNVQFVENI